MVGNPEIIIAEDEIGMHPLYETHLEDSGYGVKICKDGQEAWEYFNSRNGQNIAAVITDLRMPRRDGIWLARSLRDAGSQVPIALVCVIVKEIGIEYRNEILKYADLLDQKDNMFENMGAFVGKLFEARSIRKENPNLPGFYTMFSVGLG